MGALAIFLTQAAQNASLTLLIRARASDSLRLTAIATFIAQVISLVLLRQTIANLDSWPVMSAQVGGALAGNIAMHHLSLRFLRK